MAFIQPYRQDIRHFHFKKESESEGKANKLFQMVKKIKRGKIKYVPREVLDFMKEIKLQKQIDRDSQALRELTQYALLGRQLEDLFTLRIFDKRKRHR